MLVATKGSRAQRRLFAFLVRELFSATFYFLFFIYVVRVRLRDCACGTCFVGAAGAGFLLTGPFVDMYIYIYIFPFVLCTGRLQGIRVRSILLYPVGDLFVNLGGECIPGTCFEVPS